MVDLRHRYKQCATCGRRLRVREFSKNSSSPDGLRSNCKECARVSKARWYVDNKNKTNSKRAERRNRVKQFVIAAKSKPCTDCQIQYHYSMMEFDHVRGDKVMNVSAMIIASLSFWRLQEEIDKCDVVCVLCHRVRTWNRQNPSDPITTDPVNDKRVRPTGEAAAFQAVQGEFDSRRPLECAYRSAADRRFDTPEPAGSIPAARTKPRM